MIVMRLYFVQCILYSTSSVIVMYLHVLIQKYDVPLLFYDCNVVLVLLLDCNVLDLRDCNVPVLLH
jgi:hypothetical protein